MQINVFKKLKDVRFFNIWGGIEETVVFSGVSIDSRTIQKGEIFFAFPGERYDGHDYVKQASSKGALAAVVEKAWFDKNKLDLDETAVSLIVVDDSLRALQTLAHFHRKKFDIPIIGITGTNGKTTTKEMLGDVLSRKYDVLKNKGNLNNHIGLPLTLLELTKSHQIAVAEMGINDFGELIQLCQIAQPQFGLITNIGHGHLEFFGSKEKVAVAKGELFEYLGDSGTGFVNLDDPLVVEQSEKIRNKITYGIEHSADVIGRILNIRSDGCYQFSLNNEIDIQLNVPGRHSVINALAASTVGMHFDVPLHDIKNALEVFQATSNRMQFLEINGITVLNDVYNSNSDSVQVALDVVEEIAHKHNKRSVIVLGDMLELGDVSQAEHEAIGREIVNRKFDFLLAYGKESKATIEMAQSLGMKDAQHFEDKKNLAEALNHILQTGDIVLIKGSRGMAMEEVLEKIQEAIG